MIPESATYYLCAMCDNSVYNKRLLFNHYKNKHIHGKNNFDLDYATCARGFTYICLICQEELFFQSLFISRICKTNHIPCEKIASQNAVPFYLWFCYKCNFFFACDNLVLHTKIYHIILEDLHKNVKYSCEIYCKMSKM